MYPNILDKICHPSVILIKGKRGSGKTALGFTLLEYITKKYDLEAFVFGIPIEKRHLLPDFIHNIRNIKSFVSKSCILVDEAGIQFYAREHQLEDHILIARIIDYSRQNNMSLIFVTHHTRKLDVNIVADVDIIIIKEPSLLHGKFERPEMRLITNIANDFFKEITRCNKNTREHAYIISDTYEGGAINSIPSFWCEDISTIYGSEVLLFDDEEEIQEPVKIKIPRSFKDLPVYDIVDRESILHICNKNGSDITHNKCAEILVIKEKRLCQFFYIKNRNLANIIIKDKELMDIEEKVRLFGNIFL